VVDLVTAGQSFRLTSLVVYACAGIILIRMVRNGRAHALVAERWHTALEPLTEVGGMWLTMYVGMTLGTAAYLQLAPAGSRDDSWAVLACLVVGALLFAVAWTRIFRNTRFREGPVEGLFDLLARRDPHTGHAAVARPTAAEDYSLRSRT
jgi:uncharacterized membrane protein YeiB